MTDEEKEMWNALVDHCKNDNSVWGWHSPEGNDDCAPAILAADQELKRLREAVECDAEVAHSLAA